MLKKLGTNINRALMLSFMAVSVTACVAPPPPQGYAKPKMPVVKSIPYSKAVVCRDKLCAPAASSMTKEYLVNNVHKLLEKNIAQDVFFCEANENTRTCISDDVEFPVIAGVAPGSVRMSSARLLDARTTNIANRVEFVFDYDVRFNGLKINCTPSYNVAYARSADYMIIEDNEYKCMFTTMFHSLASNVYTVDFVDLDYGFIGAHYSIGVSGPAAGGASGYLLMRFPRGINPMPGESAELTSTPLHDNNISGDNMVGRRYY